MVDGQISEFVRTRGRIRICRVWVNGTNAACPTMFEAFPGKRLADLALNGFLLLVELIEYCLVALHSACVNVEFGLQALSRKGNAVHEA